MRKKSDPNQQHVRLPCGRKVKIQSVEGETALIIWLRGWRMGSPAVCPVAKLKRA